MKKDVISATRLWIQSNFIEDIDSHIPKTDIAIRYAHHAQQSGGGRVHDSTVGKYILQLFPNTKTNRPHARGAKPSFFGIRWADQPTPPLPDTTNWSTFLGKLKGSIPTLRRVPRGARLPVAQALLRTIQEVTTTNHDDNWGKLFTFPYAVIAVPSKSDHVKNLTTWVKSRVVMWESDHTTAVPPPRTPHPPSNKPQKQSQIAKKVEAKLSDGDISGAIRLLSSDDTIATPNEATISSLQEKHPYHPEPANFPEPPEQLDPPSEVSSEELSSALSSFPPGSAGGLDAPRPQIVKDLLGQSLGETGEKLGTAITNLINIILQGGVPTTFCPTFYGASLTALNKKGGGIRPIAVGNTWRRLVAKVVVARITPALVEHFSPHQLGVGIRGGAEIGAHAARRYWNHPHTTPKAFLKIDFSNAFNEIRRDCLLNIVKDRLLLIFLFVAQAYSSPSNLQYGTTPISSQLGVQQGDPCGPGLFCLVLQPVVEAVQTEFNMWYLDDGTIADSPEEVLTAFETVRRMGTDVGLHLNEAKCEVGIFGGDPNTHEDIYEMFRQVSPDIQKISPEVATLLGAPLTDSAIEKIMEKKTSQLSTLGDRLRQLSSHSAFFLLRASISIPRLIYFLRCAPTWRNHAALLLYDNALKIAVEGILNCSLSPDSWSQSSLPVKFGGLGVRHAVETAIPSFLASSYSCLPHLNSLLPDFLCEQDDAVTEGEQQWSLHGPTELPPMLLRGSQKVWELPIITKTISTLLSTALTPHDTARILAMDQPHAGAWLNALPSPQLGTHLSNDSFRVAVAFRLGCEICQPHRCPCGADVTSKGYHGLSCKKSAGRWSRHEAANDIIARALRSAEVQCIREPAGCSREDGKRPDGMTLVPWTRGRSMVWDYTCVDTYAPSHLPHTTINPGSAAEKAENNKKNKYSFLQDHFLFIPVALETSGVWGGEGLSLINEIGRRISERTGDKRSATFLRQQISIATQRGNVAAILGSLPAGKELDEIYYF